MAELNGLNRSLVALAQDSTLIAVIDMSQSSWLVAGIIPGVERHPLKKLPSDPASLLRLLERWRDEASKAGHTIQRVVLAFEAGRDGFWLARWLRARDVEAQVIHPTSIAVSREHRRAKTDRLDSELLKRAFLGWLCGERGHCSMAAVPSLDEEDAKRPGRERENLVGEGADAHRQPPQGQPRPTGRSQLQADVARRCGAAPSTAHAGGGRSATEHAGRDTARHGAAAFAARADQGNRGHPERAVGKGTRGRCERDGSAIGQGGREVVPRGVV